MSDIFKAIQSRNISMRKEKNSLAQETTFLIASIKSEAKVKNPSDPVITDSMVISAIRSQIKKAKETISLAAGKTDVSHIEKGIAEIEQFLPVETSEEDIKKFVIETIGDTEKSIKMMGQIMSKLKEKFKDSLNPQVASKIVKEILS